MEKVLRYAKQVTLMSTKGDDEDSKAKKRNRIKYQEKKVLGRNYLTFDLMEKLGVKEELEQLGEVGDLCSDSGVMRKKADFKYNEKTAKNLRNTTSKKLREERMEKFRRDKRDKLLKGARERIKL